MNGASCLRGLLLVILATGLRAEEKPAGETAKTGNWLVDAMAEKSDGTPGGSKTDATRAAMKASRTTARTEEAVANPLASYLNTWMTPSDLELLKSQGTEAPGSSLATGPQRPAKAGANAGLRANPYLVDPTVGPAAAAKQPLTTPAPKPPVPAGLEAKIDAAPAKTPGPPAEIRKSQEDAKYFPQLKRF